MNVFTDTSLPAPLQQALAHLNFSTPTPIQTETIPLALAGHDILGSAQTGTGKTGAFGIPLVAHLLNNQNDTALVLTPTRELASQVLDALQGFLGARSPVRSALLIGGEPMGRQFQQLRGKPRLIVGTPGRINDHLNRGSLDLSRTHYLVLDETDRMLDMGFGVQLARIAEFLPEKRQTLMFSATLPAPIVKMSNQYLTDPVRISVGSLTAPAEGVEQSIVHVTEAEKYSRLLNELEQREGTVILFVKTKWGAEKMADKLNQHSHHADALHGDLRQRQREQVLYAFRQQKYRILVATDVAARGLDIPHIAHVINYDLPQCPEDFIHRLGRTARGGAAGAAVTLVTPQDGRKWQAINRLLNPGAKQPANDRKPAGSKPGNRYKGKPASRNSNSQYDRPQQHSRRSA